MEELHTARPNSGFLERRTSCAVFRPSETESKNQRDKAFARSRDYWRRLVAQPQPIGYGPRPPPKARLSLTLAALPPVTTRINASRMRFQRTNPRSDSDSRTNSCRFPSAHVQLVVHELLERVVKNVNLNADPRTQRRAIDALLLEDMSQREVTLGGLSLQEHQRRQRGGGGLKSERESGSGVNRQPKERPYSTGNAVGSASRPFQPAVSPLDSSRQINGTRIRPLSRSAGSSSKTVTRAFHERNERRRQEARLYFGDATEDELLSSPAEAFDVLFGTARASQLSSRSLHSPNTPALSPTLELQFRTREATASESADANANAVADPNADANHRQWCIELADIVKRAVRERVRLSGRFRLVCVLSVCSSDVHRRGQHSALVASRCLWNDATDRCVSVAVRCSRARAFIIALVFALYTE